MTVSTNSSRIRLRGVVMDYFAARNRCKKCGILNHLFVDLKEIDKRSQHNNYTGINVNYSIEIFKVNGKVKREFQYGYSCPWCKQYNKHETVFGGVEMK